MYEFIKNILDVYKNKLISWETIVILNNLSNLKWLLLVVLTHICILCTLEVEAD